MSDNNIPSPLPDDSNPSRVPNVKAKASCDTAKLASASAEVSAHRHTFQFLIRILQRMNRV
jgi:hypothetical protein